MSNFKSYIQRVRGVVEDEPQTLDIEPSEGSVKSFDMTFDHGSGKIDIKGNINTQVVMGDTERVNQTLQTTVRAALLNFLRTQKNGELPLDAQQVGRIKVTLGSVLRGVLDKYKSKTLGFLVTNMVEFLVSLKNAGEDDAYVVVEINPDLVNKIVRNSSAQAGQQTTDTSGAGQNAAAAGGPKT